MKSFTMLAFVLAIMALSLFVAEAKPLPKTYTLSTKLSGEDAGALFKVMRVSTTQVGEGEGSYAQKKMLIGTENSEYALSLDCRARENYRACAVVLKSASSLQSGAVLQGSQVFSEALVSALKLEPRPKLGEGWSAYESSGGEFGIWCEQIYTPTDLPMYTHCSLRIVTP